MAVLSADRPCGRQRDYKCSAAFRRPRPRVEYGAAYQYHRLHDRVHYYHDRDIERAREVCVRCVRQGLFFELLDNIFNGSPNLFYKTFDANDNVTSVVIPVNEEYYRIKNGINPKEKVWIESETKDIKQIVLNSGYTTKTKQKILKLYNGIGTEIFGNSRVAEILECSEVTATSYLKIMGDELKITVPVQGLGKGKYRFRTSLQDSEA